MIISLKTLPRSWSSSPRHHIDLHVVFAGTETMHAGGEFFQSARDAAREEQRGNHRDAKRARADGEREEQLFPLPRDEAADLRVRFHHRDRLSRGVQDRRVAADPAAVFVLDRRRCSWAVRFSTPPGNVRDSASGIV